MISPLLGKLYGIILENKINTWLESQGKMDKEQASFIRYHYTITHLFTLRIIVEEYRNNKFNIFCCFVNFRKYFDTIPRNNLWKQLEELKVPFKLSDIAIRFYKNAISKFKINTKGWPKDINCNI